MEYVAASMVVARKKSKRSLVLCLYSQSNLHLRTQLVKNGCTYCEKYLNQGTDFHRLTYVTWFNWSMTFRKKVQNFDKPLGLHVKGYNWSMTFPKKIPKLPKDLKQNLNWNQTLQNEVDLTVK
jgi:hypothetical protein